LFISVTSWAQINYNANSSGKVKPYTGFYNFGSNVGYYDQTWNDKTLADIAAGNPAYNVPGVGVKAFRALLNERFLASNDPALGSDAYGWGYNIRVPEFQHYQSIGMKDHVVFLAVNVLNADRKDYIRPDHVDNTIYPGCNEKSKIFKNIYEPIWDGGANGTPVNDNNYFALFVYNTVLTYKPYVKFWEIGNEPDYTGSVGSFALPGQAGNWWDNPPNACDLTNLKAPVFSYIRMLRIAYEVIKFTDPEAYVATGGIGYPSFLDNILRYTDNPDGGKVTAEYANKGGAFFDVLSFHEYPQYVLSENVNGTRVYHRHSDAAAQAVIKKKNDMQTVLTKYGYNGATYPEKVWILTEVNIPRKKFAGSNDIGGDEVQRNFYGKTLVLNLKNNIRQTHVFNLGEVGDENAAQYPGNEVMGLYYNLQGKGPLVFNSGTGGYDNSGNYRQQPNQEGIVAKTVSNLLYGYNYDGAKTALLNLPPEVDGGAFQDGTGKYIYALWAKTTVDNSESASASYSFPAEANVSSSMEKRSWNYSQTGSVANVSSQGIVLNGEVSFFSNGSGSGTDTQAPSIPTGLVASNITGNSFTLSWTASTDNVGVTGYDVYKDGVKINSINVDATSYNVTGLTPATTYTMTVKAKDAAGNASLPSDPLGVTTLNTCPTLVVSPGTLPDAVFGLSYNTQVTLNGGVAPYTLVNILPSLPSGLQFAMTGANIGTFTGTPSRAGSYTFNMVFKDANGCSVNKQIALLVKQNCPVISITTDSLVEAIAGKSLQIGLAVTGGNAPYLYEADNLPPGLSLNTSGVITGTPTQSGEVISTIRVTDFNGCTGRKQFRFIILPSGSLPSGTVGNSYLYYLNTGSNVYRTYTLASGSLPTGLSLEGTYAAIYGSPQVSGFYTFSLTGTDAQGNQTTQQYSINISCPTLTILSDCPSSSLGNSYLVNLYTSGGSGSYVYSLTGGSLPPGLFFEGAYGAVYGNPTQTGSYSFTITSTDTRGCKTSRTYVVNISCPAFTITSTLSSSSVGSSFLINLTTSGATGHVIFSLTGGSLPPGLSLEGYYAALFGSPQQTGTYDFTLTATDSKGCQAVKSFSMTITPSGGRLAQTAVKGSSAESEVSAITLYPNPATDKVVLSAGKKQEIRVEIIDIFGRKVYDNLHTTDGRGETECQINHLASGNYFLRVVENGKNHVLKFIKY
jgi:hypothetical protein